MGRTGGTVHLNLTDHPTIGRIDLVMGDDEESAEQFVQEATVFVLTLTPDNTKIVVEADCATRISSRPSP